MVSKSVVIQQQKEKINRINLRLRESLLVHKGNVLEIAEDLRINEDVVEKLIDKFGLNIDNYQSLSKPVGLVQPSIKAIRPNLEDSIYLVQPSIKAIYPYLKDSICPPTENDLNELGWRNHWFEGMEIWEKGPVQTYSTARIVVDYSSNSSHILFFELYDSDNKPIVLNYGRPKIVTAMIGKPNNISATIIRNRRWAFGDAEMYLSDILLQGKQRTKELETFTTGRRVLEAKSLFKRYRIKDEASLVMTASMGQLRTYLSGGIISLDDFYNMVEVVKEYDIPTDQILKSRSSYKGGLNVSNFAHFFLDQVLYHDSTSDPKPLDTIVKKYGLSDCQFDLLSDLCPSCQLPVFIDRSLSSDRSIQNQVYSK
ncbi:MAG: hypothetical protein ABIC04_02765 [Nanoarchaeota archaeon]